MNEDAHLEMAYEDRFTTDTDYFGDVDADMGAFDEIDEGEGYCEGCIGLFALSELNRGPGLYRPLYLCPECWMEAADIEGGW